MLPRRLRRMSPADLLLAFALLAACAGLLTQLPPAPRLPPVAGRARAIDGDSLRLGGTDIRLRGIDAPELGQRCQRPGGDYGCGQAARAWLAGRLTAGETICEPSGLDRYGRTLALCRIGGEDLAAALAREGLAISYGGYEQEEAQARGARRGLWGGTFELPADWRRRHPRTGS